jgi:hypothetical protein
MTIVAAHVLPLSLYMMHVMSLATLLAIKVTQVIVCQSYVFDYA